MAQRILVTDGTGFVGKSVVQFFVARGDKVTVLNSANHSSHARAQYYAADRHHIGMHLYGKSFDAVIDVNAFNANDVEVLLHALHHAKYSNYVLLSSCAVYPETNLQPFVESARLGLTTAHALWQPYSEGKVAAERALLERAHHPYIIRPSYLYGPMNSVYREAFVFDCANADRVFYLPQDGTMQLQFFHVRDLCRFIDVIITQQPQQYVYNVGNAQTVSVREWVDMCYNAAGKRAQYANVHNNDVEQHHYFPFYNYQYELDVQAQHELMPTTTPLEDGLRESYEWYSEHPHDVEVKPYVQFIDDVLKKQHERVYQHDIERDAQTSIVR